MSGRRVLFVRLDNAGDVVLTGPAVRAVSASGARVIYLTSRAGRAAAELLPGVDDIVVYDAPWVAYDAPAADRASVDSLIDTLSSIAIDEAFVCTSFHQSPLPIALLLRLAGVGRIAATSVDYPGSLLDVRHRVIEGHEVEQSLSLVATLGHRLPHGDDDRLRLRGPLPRTAPFDDPYVVVHPGASVPARAIDLQTAADAVAMLVDDGWHVAVTGSAAEHRLTRAVAGARGARVVDLGGVHDLRGLAGVIHGAEAIVVGNTGPAHIAAAVGTPVVSIFAPVVPAERWLPWRVPAVVLGDGSVPCAGCRARTCPLPVQHCLAPVTASAITGAVRSLTTSTMAVAV